MEQLARRLGYEPWDSLPDWRQKAIVTYYTNVFPDLNVWNWCQDYWWKWSVGSIAWLPFNANPVIKA